jgi:hypothetical protein
MHYILGRHRVADAEAWKRTMESHRADHLKAGLHFERVWRNADDPREILFLYRVDDLMTAKSYLEQAGALDQAKQQLGEIPELLFLVSV